MVGLGGGVSGTGTQGPQGAGIIQGATGDQANAAYTANQAALQGQNSLLTALQGQNGLGNQNQVYGQLQGIASGAVNPAQAQFNQNTAQNVGTQAALMAGQRGAGANVGLMARQIGQQGAATQQQAVGQEATQQATNQINAIGQAGQMANTQAQQQIGQTNANTQAQQAEQSNLLNGIGQTNSASVGSQGSVNSANAGIAQAQIPGQQNLIGGMLNSGAKALAMADGGMAAPGVGVAPQQPTGPQSSFGKFLSGVAAPPPGTNGAEYNPGQTPGQKQMYTAGQSIGNLVAGAIKGQPSAGNVAGPDSGAGNSNMCSGGGEVEVVVSPGEKIASPREAQRAAQGGTAKMQTVPGKAKVAGDSIQNDTVSKKLPIGSVVVKRTRANNNPEGFIKEVLSKRKASK